MERDPQSTTSKGQRGEARAAQYLSSLGYQIVERNARTAGGEIDLIAIEGGDLVFVEVRSRKDGTSGDAEETIGYHKRRRLGQAAMAYIGERTISFDSCRFDIVAITGAEIVLYQDAFRFGLLERY